MKGEILKRSTRTDCKSVGYTFVGSNPSFPTIGKIVSGGSSVGRATAFQAVGRGFDPRLPLFLSRCSSEVEYFLGKEEVTGSNPVIGSI